ncbi:serum paraoxonase/arylesteras-like protein [Amylocarpus encephaloides]|uniref:Serum paraoxonase/arylesteras-like protein n=1 Tax=Amylocarpus encephaloides TaxID=45428 RepID=A0A9P7YH94_9HELO|nr:serum paraoxonase/arylesteras-like protein [Amylocarpus encephaloides]
MMASRPLIFASLILIIAITFQPFFKTLIFVQLGIGRAHQKIDEFPYDCQRLRHPLLDSCEDMVIDTEGRRIYAACSSVVGRMGWMPNNDKFNTTLRQKTDHITILPLDVPPSTVLSNLRTLALPTTYQSSASNQEIDTLALTIEQVSPDRLRLFAVNHRPPVGMDPETYGANSTIEVFELERGGGELEYVKTIWSEGVVKTPNNLVGDGEGGVWVTNDHDAKVGKLRVLEIFRGGGSVAYCPPSKSSCHLAAEGIFNFANGIARDTSGLIYVSNSALGTVTVLSHNSTTQLLTHIHTIEVRMPIDNLSLDPNGDIYVAAFPDVLGLVLASSSSAERDVGSSVFRVRKVVKEGGELAWDVEKMMEDVEGRVLPMATVVVHDAETGNLWLGGIASPYITLCERRKE